MCEADDMLALVSYRAVTRYVQRILGTTLPESADNRCTAEAHCAAVGRTIEDIRQTIMTPGMRFAARAGFPLIGTPTFRAQIDTSTGVVTTILEPFSHHSHGKLRIATPAEARRAAHRFHRRLRRGGAA